MNGGSRGRWCAYPVYPSRSSLHFSILLCPRLTCMDCINRRPFLWLLVWIRTMTLRVVRRWSMSCMTSSVERLFLYLVTPALASSDVEVAMDSCGYCTVSCWVAESCHSYGSSLFLMLISYPVWVHHLDCAGCWRPAMKRRRTVQMKGRAHPKAQKQDSKMFRE